jgi:hypothetical protein
MLWNYSSWEYCLYTGPDWIWYPLKLNFSWFWTHFYLSLQNFLYVACLPGLPSRVLYHLFWIVSTCWAELEWLLCIKLQHIPSPTVSIVHTGAGFCCLPEPKLRCLMFCLPLVPGSITLIGGRPTKHPHLIIPPTSAVEYFLRKNDSCVSLMVPRLSIICAFCRRPNSVSCRTVINALSIFL